MTVAEFILGTGATLVLSVNGVERQRIALDAWDAKPKGPKMPPPKPPKRPKGGKGC